MARLEEAADWPMQLVTFDSGGSRLIFTFPRQPSDELLSFFFSFSSSSVVLLLLGGRVCNFCFSFVRNPSSPSFQFKKK